MKICPNCGLENLSHSRSCARCESDLTKVGPAVWTKRLETEPVGHPPKEDNRLSFRDLPRRIRGIVSRRSQEGAFHESLP